MAYWTDEREQRLAGLVAQGLSYSAVAKRMGDGCTPGMVCGKVDRLRRRRGFDFPMRDKTGAISRHDTSSNRLYRDKRGKLSFRDRSEGLIHSAHVGRKGAFIPDPKFRSAMARMEAEAAVRTDLLTLAEISKIEEENEEITLCRYIPGEPSGTRIYCGCKTVPGQPYCEDHFVLCCPGAPLSRPQVEQIEERQLEPA